jgi:hypothetical protein
MGNPPSASALRQRATSGMKRISTAPLHRLGPCCVNGALAWIVCPAPNAFLRHTARMRASSHPHPAAFAKAPARRVSATCRAEAKRRRVWARDMFASCAGDRNSRWTLQAVFSLSNTRFYLSPCNHSESRTKNIAYQTARKRPDTGRFCEHLDSRSHFNNR